MTRNQSFTLGIGWRLLLKDSGIRSDHVLRRAGLPADLLSRRGQLMSTEAFFDLWRAIEAEARDPMIALRIVEKVTTESFDPPIFAALCSADLTQAVQRLAKYKQLTAPMKIDVTVRSAGMLSVSPRWLFAEGDVPLSLEIAELAFVLRLHRHARACTGFACDAVATSGGAAPATL